MDVVIMNAACSDFTPSKVETHKIKKGKGTLTVSLECTPDILSHIRDKKKKQLIVGFSLDTREREADARKKMEEKGVDIMIANTTASIGGEHVEMLILTKKSSPQQCEKMSKQEAARKIIDLIASSL
jgi:phosphopantothenoylcysteine decarboxylase/phosphopantothenate--cysteine ligase